MENLTPTTPQLGSPTGKLVRRQPDYWREDKVYTDPAEPSPRTVPKPVIILGGHPNQDIIPDTQTGAATKGRDIGLEKTPPTVPTGDPGRSHAVPTIMWHAAFVKRAQHRTSSTTRSGSRKLPEQIRIHLVKDLEIHDLPKLAKIADRIMEMLSPLLPNPSSSSLRWPMLIHHGSPLNEVGGQTYTPHSPGPRPADQTPDAHPDGVEPASTTAAAIYTVVSAPRHTSALNPASS